MFENNTLYLWSWFVIWRWFVSVVWCDGMEHGFSGSQGTHQGNAPSRSKQTNIGRRGTSNRLAQCKIHHILHLQFKLLHHHPRRSTSVTPISYNNQKALGICVAWLGQLLPNSNKGGHCGQPPVSDVSNFDISRLVTIRQLPIHRNSGTMFRLSNFLAAWVFSTRHHHKTTMIKTLFIP